MQKYLFIKLIILQPIILFKFEKVYVNRNLCKSSLKFAKIVFH